MRARRSPSRWLSLPVALLALALISAQAPQKPGVPIINAPGAIAGTLSVPLTIQETLYTGGSSGVARTNEPITVGLPLPDNSSAGTAEVSDLALTGASGLQQFRVLGRWPSGRIKWVQVDTQASLSAGGTHTGIALVKVRGSGNAGGTNLAADTGATLTVTTGAATFTIKKANFNGFDQVVVGGTTVVTTGTSTGLVVMGPAFSGTTSTCGTCTTVYSSSNDGASTAEIEENGPARAVIKATGAYKDGSGNVYLRYTVRMHFYKNKASVRAATTLRNADLGGSNTFASAFKGMAANEWRTTVAISGTRSYRVAKDAGTEATGTMSGTNDVYVYGGQTEWLRHELWGGSGSVPPTDDVGWKVILNGNTGAPVDSGGITEHVDGWADIRDASGVGLSIGIEQMHAWWAKSLEFKAGGSDVRIGIWSAANSRSYHQAWPHWNTHDLYFNFHSAALSAPADEFLKFQHYLVGRSTLAYFNSTAAWPHQVASATEEDTFYSTTTSTANPSHAQTVAAVADASPAGGSLSNGNALRVYRNWDWGSGGESNQQDWRIGWIDQWLSRGFDSRLLNARYFYRYLMNDLAPRSDGYAWRDQTGAKDTKGWPTATSLNASLGFRAIGSAGGVPDHSHWYGMGLYYFLSGDEGVKDAFLDGYADWSLDSATVQAGIVIGGEVGNDGTAESRIASLSIITAVYMARFLRDIGLTADANQALTNAETLYHADFDDVLCTQQEETAQSCDSHTTLSVEKIDGMIPQSVTASTLNEGISRTRGIVWNGGGLQTWCGVTETNTYDNWRLSSVWSGQAWWAWALSELADAKGPTWADYWIARDLVYGIIQAAEDEFWEQQGNGRWDQDGFKLYTAFDRAGNCLNPPPANDNQYFKGTFCGGSGFCSPQSHWILFSVKQRLTGSQDWIPKARVSINKALQYTGGQTPDYYGWMANAMIADANATPASTLQTLTLTSATHQGSGNYLLSWTAPAGGATSYRIKWGAKTIVEWIGFNEYTGTFVGNPTTTMPWFAATNVASVPAPAAPFTTQTTTVATGNTGLSLANFSLKASCTSTCSQVTSAPTSITWTLQTNPSDVPHLMYFTDLKYNPVSAKVIAYLVRGAGASIYASSIHEYQTNANDWTDKGGSTPSGNDCYSHASASPLPWPGNRHPVGQMAIDTTRNKLHLMGGVCQGPVGTGWRDHWTYDLTTYTWTQLSAIETLSVPNVWSNMVYSAAVDLIALFGESQTWVYCPSATVNSTQIAAGCTTAQTWYQTTNMPVGFPGSQWTSGHKNSFFDDPINGRAVYFAKAEFAGGREVWTYNYATKLFAPRTGTTGIPTGAPSTTAGDKDHVRITTGTFAGAYLFHWTAPISDSECSGATADYLYNYTANAYTSITTVGTGPYCAVHLVWDEAAGKVVSWGKKLGSGEPGIWTGVLK